MDRQGAAPVPSWHLRYFGKAEQACYEKEPDLREVLNQDRQGRMVANIPIQPVTPLMLPHQDVPVFQSVRDLDRQCQRHFNQTVTKHQPYPLEDEDRKRAKTPPQPDLEDTPSGSIPGQTSTQDMNAATLRPEKVTTDRRSWTRHAVKVENAVRAGHTERAERGVRVRHIAKAKCAGMRPTAEHTRREVGHAVATSCPAIAMNN